MAQRPVLEVADRWFGRINANINASATTIVLKASGATGLPSRTIIHHSTEKMLVTDIDVDTPSAGLDTITVERGYGGTTALSHVEDDVLASYYYEDFHNETVDRVSQLEAFIDAYLGRREGRVQDGGLQVVEAGTPDMTVSITAGAAVVSGQPVALRAAQSIAIVAPVTNPRIDVVRLSQAGVASVVTGTEAGSPSAPATGTGYLKLAEVALTTSMTEIENADITDAGGYL